MVYKHKHIKRCTDSWSTECLQWHVGRHKNQFGDQPPKLQTTVGKPKEHSTKTEALPSYVRQPNKLICYYYKANSAFHPSGGGK